MTGKEEYDSKKRRLINNLLDKNPKYLSYFDSYIGINKSYDTRYNYLLTVRDFVEKTNKPLENLCIGDFTIYLSNIVETKCSQYGIRAHAALKQFGSYLKAERILSDNPMQDIKRPKYKETKELQHKRDIGYLNKKEIQQVKYNIKHGVGNVYARGRQETFMNRDMLIFLVFISTGMRCSALSKLDITDINIKTKIVSVYDKGDKINTYKLPDEVMKYYKLWLSDRDKMFGRENKAALFISRKHNRMTPAAISFVVKKYCENIEGKHITPHKLRATFGTQMYEATGDIYFTQQMMCHSNPKTTELYIRGQKEINVDKAANIMSKILG